MRHRISNLKQQQRRIANKLREKDPQLANKLAAVELDWYRIRNSADDSEVADLYIYDDIVPNFIAEFLGGVSAESLISELNEITASTVNVHINSPGGAVFEAIAIYNALVAHPADIHVYVDALAASAASVIAMAGDTVTMMVGSQMMIHDAMGAEIGNAKELRAFADFLDTQSDNIASVYAARTGGSAEEFRALMLAETWLNAQEAVDLGLADSVYVKSKTTKAEESEEETETEEDSAKEESEEDDPPAEESEEDEEEALASLLSRKHSIAARGFKYAGRRKAPAPVIDSLESEVDALMAKLGGK